MHRDFAEGVVVAGIVLRHGAFLAERGGREAGCSGRARFEYRPSQCLKMSKLLIVEHLSIRSVGMSFSNEFIVCVKNFIFWIKYGLLPWACWNNPTRY